MKLIVCGGRNFDNMPMLAEALDVLHKSHIITCLIHGGARGADSMAAMWADANNIKQWVFNAEWNRDGRSAGAIRNRRMLVEGKPDMVVAFPGGQGTKHMVEIARKAQINIIEVESR